MEHMGSGRWARRGWRKGPADSAFEIPLLMSSCARKGVIPIRSASSRAEVNDGLMLHFVLRDKAVSHKENEKSQVFQFFWKRNLELQIFLSLRKGAENQAGRDHDESLFKTPHHKKVLLTIHNPSKLFTPAHRQDEDPAVLCEGRSLTLWAVQLSSLPYKYLKPRLPCHEIM